MNEPVTNMNDQVTSKVITLRIDKWMELSRFAKEVSAQLGIELSLPDAITFAIKYTKENRLGDK